MFLPEEITLKQYVELAKEIKERYEYINVKKTSAFFLQNSFLSVQCTRRLAPLPQIDKRTD